MCVCVCGHVCVCIRSWAGVILDDPVLRYEWWLFLGAGIWRTLIFFVLLCVFYLLTNECVLLETESARGRGSGPAHFYTWG